jgi:hypothetical protein
MSNDSFYTLSQAYLYPTIERAAPFLIPWTSLRRMIHKSMAPCGVCGEYGWRSATSDDLTPALKHRHRWHVGLVIRDQAQFKVHFKFLGIMKDFHFWFLFFGELYPFSNQSRGPSILASR